MNLVGASVNAEHDVSPDQYEPGLADENQAHVHDLSIKMADLNISTSIGLSFRSGIELRIPVRLFDVYPNFIGEDGNDLLNYESIHHRDETLFGFGDVAVVGRYRLLEPTLTRRISVDLRLGASLPTGRTEDDPFKLGNAGISHQHVMFGSGTIDPIFGVESVLRFGGASVASWTQLSISPIENSYGYQAPTKVMSGTSLSSSFGLEKWSFSSGFEVYHETPAMWSGEPAYNSGRTDIIAAGGINYLQSEKWNYQLQLKSPHTVQSLGGQMSTPLIVVVGISRNTLLGHTHNHE